MALNIPLNLTVNGGQTGSITNTSLNQQPQSTSVFMGVDAAGNTVADHSYFASSVSSIKIGRDPVTSLSTVEPSHVFDIVYNLDLNTLLGDPTDGADVYAPQRVDSDEKLQEKDGGNLYKYNLTTGSFTADIFLRKIENRDPVTNALLSVSVEFNSSFSDVTASGYLSTSVYGYDFTVASSNADSSAHIPAVSAHDAKEEDALAMLAKLLSATSATAVYVYTQGSTSQPVSSTLTIEPLNAGKRVMYGSKSEDDYRYALGTFGNTGTSGQVVNFVATKIVTTSGANNSVSVVTYTADGKSVFGSGTSVLPRNTNLGLALVESEKLALVQLARQMYVDSAGLVKIILKPDGSVASDGLSDMGSTISPLMVANSSVLSNGVFNSLLGQTQQLNSFMAKLKGGLGLWYAVNTYNRLNVTTQVRNGLAQLFDRDPQLNNLIGSSATAGSFLDQLKIELKLQGGASTNYVDPSLCDTFYNDLFAVQQLREVLDAVADRGNRILFTSKGNRYAFQPGDSITAIVRVTDTDSGSANSDRWLVTLQHV